MRTIAVVSSSRVLPAFYVTLFGYVGLATLVALGLVLLTGVSGQTSFGQASFVGLAAYATTLLTRFAGAPPIAGPGRRAGADRRDRLVARRWSPRGCPATSWRWSRSPGASASSRCSAPCRGCTASTASATFRRCSLGPLSAAEPAGQSRRDLGRGRDRDGDVRQFARQPHRPRDPHAERRAADGRERRHRHRAPQPHRVRHRRAVRRRRGISVRAFPALHQPDAVQPGRQHRLSVHGHHRRRRIAVGRAGGRRAGRGAARPVQRLDPAHHRAGRRFRGCWCSAWS